MAKEAETTGPGNEFEPKKYNTIHRILLKLAPQFLPKLVLESLSLVSVLSMSGVKRTVAANAEVCAPVFA